MPNELTPALEQAYQLLHGRHGHLRWWPAETPFEVCVGAILVQNTAWSNVERAIANLKQAGLLDAAKMLALPVADLEALIRPSGSFRIKARRLRHFLEVLVHQHGARLESLFAGPTAEVRARLLVIHGIGPETADCLLLYAGGHARFVIDAYARRVFSRHGWLPEGDALSMEYDRLQTWCETALDRHRGAARAGHWGDFHAQLVEVGKRHCRRSRAACKGCPLEPLLPPGGAIV